MSTIEVAPETSTWSRTPFVPSTSTPAVPVNINTEEWVFALIFFASMVGFLATFLKRKAK